MQNEAFGNKMQNISHSIKLSLSHFDIDWIQDIKPQKREFDRFEKTRHGLLAFTFNIEESFISFEF